MITAFYHPGFAADIGEHIMPMRKFALVAEALAARPALGVRLVEPAPVREEELRRVHTAAYIDAVRTGEPRGLAKSQKFPWSAGLYGSVCLTNGAVLAAAREALKPLSRKRVQGTGVFPGAGGLPGAGAGALVSGFHHSCSGHGEGFCTFNGLIVAIDAMRAAGEIKTAAVMDMDLHYGNGTAQLAASRPYVTAVSVYGNDYWDNTPYRDVSVRHHEDGANHFSFALPVGCDRATMMGVLDAALPALLRQGKPDVLLYQAGADPYFEDPYSPLRLDHDDLLARDRRVFEFARTNEIPVAWVLAGGYTKDVSKVVRVHVNTFVAWREVNG